MTTARLLKNINTGGYGSDPWQFTQAGNTLFFVARDNTVGQQLWKTDGTTTGTTALTDVLVYRYGHPNFMGFSPGALTPAGNLLFFTATDDDFGRELWKTDGTEEGTKRFTDIMPGKDGSNPDALTVIGDTIFYSAFHKDFGRELWKTNISTGQTQIVKDIRPGIESGIGYYLKAVGNTLFFTADNGVNGLELWKHDINTKITSMVRDIHPDPGFIGRLAAPRQLTAVGNQLYFTVDDGRSGRELWVTNGTETGTRIVKDINPFGDSSRPYLGLSTGSTLFFSAEDKTNGRELWQINRLSGITRLVADINPGIASSNPGRFTQVGNTIYFIANDGTNGTNLWRYDLGSEAATKVALESPSTYGFGYLNSVGNILYFTAYNGDSTEIWKYDVSSGTTERTLAPAVRYLTSFKDTLVFAGGNNETGSEPWILGGDYLGTLNEHLSSSNFTLNPGESKSFEITLPPGKLQPEKFSIDSYDLFFKTSGGGTGIFLYNENNEPIHWENVTPGSTVRVEVRNTSGSSINTLIDAYLWKINGSVYGSLLNPEIKQVSIKKFDKDAFSDDHIDSWVIAHGWKGNIGKQGDYGPNGQLLTDDSALYKVASEIADQNGESILLDWGSPAYYPGSPLTEPQKAAYWIHDVASFATHSLVNVWGYRSNLNLVGHSLGAYLSSEVARLITEQPVTQGYKVDRLVALDPAEWVQDPYIISNNLFDQRTPSPFSNVAQHSLALWGQLQFPFVNGEGDGAGKSIAALTATHSAQIDFIDNSSAENNHGYIIDLYRNLIGNTDDRYGSIRDYFSLRQRTGFETFQQEHEAYIGGVKANGEFGAQAYLRLRSSVLTLLGIKYRYIAVADGYISSGAVFIDINNNRSQDLGEPSATILDAGTMEFSLDEQFLAILTGLSSSPDLIFLPDSNSLDTSTGLTFKTQLAAPFGARVINPLTTLVVELTRSGATLDQANLKINKALNIPSATWLPMYDPLAALGQGYSDAHIVFARSAAVQNLVTQVTSFLKGSSDLAAGPLSFKVFAAIAAQISGETVLDLTQEDRILAIINSTVIAANITLSADLTALLPDVAFIIAEGQRRLEQISLADPYQYLDEVARVQVVSQGLVAAALANLVNNPLSAPLNEFSGQELDQLVAAAQVLNLLPPTISSSIFTLQEIPHNRPSSISLGSVVGAVQAFDPEGRPLAYALSNDPAYANRFDLDRDDINAFEIDTLTGEIRVSDPDDLDYEQQSFFRILATASDGLFSAAASIIINLLDVDDDLLPVAHVNDGIATFSISGTPEVGQILQAALVWDDPDSGMTGLSWQWQASSDGSTWSPVGTNSSSHLIASADQGKKLRLVVSYSDGQGFPESVTTAAGSVPLVNDGAASFSITGPPAVGNTLVASVGSADPDGNGAFSYSWQSSTDGTTWGPVGSNSPSYLVASADQGKQLRLVASYTDGQGFSEAVTTSAGSVPLVNDGAATLSVSGTPAVGNTLVASVGSADPDGNGAFSYSWQSSTNGTSWSPVGTNSSSYLIASADQGKQLRLLVSYTDGEGFDEALTIPYGLLKDLPASSNGSRLSISDPLSPALQISSNGSPDRVELQAEITVTLHARSSSTWSSAFVAHNVGSPTAPGTGEKLPLTGLGRYSFVATAIPAATTTIVLEPEKNSAFFLHDAYSAFHSSLNLSPDSTGRPSAQRLLNVDTIHMGSAGGTSIVDLTSPDYNAGPTTVQGASRGTSVFWGTEADDAFLSGGGDAVICGGLGRNAYSLGAGIDTLQYRLISGGSGATDRISSFDPSRDRLQLWTPSGQTSPTPVLSSANGSSTLSWGGHSLEFLGIPSLSLSSLTILQATAVA